MRTTVKGRILAASAAVLLAATLAPPTATASGFPTDHLTTNEATRLVFGDEILEWAHDQEIDTELRRQVPLVLARAEIDEAAAASGVDGIAVVNATTPPGNSIYLGRARFLSRSARLSIG